MSFLAVGSISLAASSLLLSLLLWLPSPSVGFVGLVLGLIAVKRIHYANIRLTGRWLAYVAVAVGGLQISLAGYVLSSTGKPDFS
jgi:hypothetical protein